jgi:hypothetical protein
MDVRLRHRHYYDDARWLALDGEALAELRIGDELGLAVDT